MSLSRSISHQLSRRLDGGVAAFLLASALGPSALVLGTLGISLYRDDQRTAMTEVLGAMAAEHVPSRVNPHWAIEAYALRSVNALERQLPAAVTEFWEEFMNAADPGLAGGVAESDLRPFAPCRFAVRPDRVTSTRPALCQWLSVPSGVDALVYLPALLVRPLQPPTTLPFPVDWFPSEDALPDLRWTHAFVSAVSHLGEMRNGRAESVVQAYFVGASGSVMLWSRESNQSTLLRSVASHDARSGPYYVDMESRVAAWQSSATPVPLTCGSFSHEDLAETITTCTLRYDDMLGAGIVWTACLGLVLSPSAASAGVRSGELLGAICADVADIRHLIDAVGRPPSTEARQTASDAERQLAISDSHLWNVGYFAYNTAEGPLVGELRLPGHTKEEIECTKADLELLTRGSTKKRRDIVLSAPSKPDCHEDAFLLPVGEYEQKARYLVLELRPDTTFGPGITELVCSAALLAATAAAWSLGWGRKVAADTMEQQSLFLNHLQVGTVLNDESGHIVAGNARAEEILGVPLPRGGPTDEAEPWSPMLDEVLSGTILIPRESAAGWQDGPELDRHSVSLRVSNLTEVTEQRARGQTSRYYARLSAETLARNRAPTFRYHPRWCPWVEVSGSPRLDRSDPREGPHPVWSYGVLRQVHPQFGWNVLEVAWMEAESERRSHPGGMVGTASSDTGGEGGGGKKQVGEAMEGSSAAGGVQHPDTRSPDGLVATGAPDNPKKSGESPARPGAGGDDE